MSGMPTWERAVITAATADGRTVSCELAGYYTGWIPVPVGANQLASVWLYVQGYSTDSYNNVTLEYAPDKTVPLVVSTSFDVTAYVHKSEDDTWKLHFPDVGFWTLDPPEDGSPDDYEVWIGYYSTSDLSALNVQWSSWDPSAAPCVRSIRST